MDSGILIKVQVYTAAQTFSLSDIVPFRYHFIAIGIGTKFVDVEDNNWWNTLH